MMKLICGDRARGHVAEPVVDVFAPLIDSPAPRPPADHRQAAQQPNNRRGHGEHEDADGAAIGAVQRAWRPLRGRQWRRRRRRRRRWCDVRDGGGCHDREHGDRDAGDTCEHGGRAAWAARRARNRRLHRGRHRHRRVDAHADDDAARCYSHHHCRWVNTRPCRDRTLHLGPHARRERGDIAGELEGESNEAHRRRQERRRWRRRWRRRRGRRRGRRTRTR